MPNARLELNTRANAWEPCRHEDSAGENIAWRAAAVRHHSTDIGELYLAASDGRILEVETSDLDDAGAPIPWLYESKRHPLGAVSLIHSVYTRLEGVTDSLSLEVRVGGSEYPERARSYTLPLTGTNEIELKTRCHRDLLGRWVSLRIFGDVSNRPALRELRVWSVPIRYGRTSS